MKLKSEFIVLVIFCVMSDICAIKHSVCGTNEMHVECYHCGPKTCADLGYPKTCKGAMNLCRSQCVCTDGYVRDGKWKCIPKNECPSCGGDKNATSGCGNHCGNRCSDYKDVNKTCFTGCRYNDCDCRTGYVYDDVLGGCVHRNDCSGSVNRLAPSAPGISIIVLIYFSSNLGIQEQ